MFHCSSDQTQWFHLYRVQKVFPTMFVLFACGDAEVNGDASFVLDLRIIAAGNAMLGGSWWVRKIGRNGHHASRADLAKFLSQRAKMTVAYATKQSVDEIEMIDSSHEELALVVSLDDELRSNLEAVVPTLFPKLARTMIQQLPTNHSGNEFEELPDWPTRHEDQPIESQSSSVAEPS